MDIRLYEKLRRVTEVVATIDPVVATQGLKNRYKGKSTKLTLSTWTRERHEQKFWLLQDGTIIPVERSHAKTVEDWGYDRDFVNTGAVAGYVHDQTGEMGIASGKKLTSRQISQLKNIAIEYKAKSLVMDIGPTATYPISLPVPIKSTKHLDYVLNYGTVDEAVATAADPQKVMKDYYKKVLNTKLTKSTWPSTREGNQYKFWLLQDGTVIPVAYSHNKTLLDAGLSLNWFSFIKIGAVGGYINLVGDEMGVTSGKNLTSKQIVRLKNLWLEYHKVRILYVDVPQRDFNSPIKSVSHLEYLLTYGKDVDESKSEEDQKEQFFVDRTNKHILLVQGAADKILKAYPEFDTGALRDQLEVHDASKLEEPERTPYVEITWRHKLEKEEGEYDPYNGKGYQTPGKLEKEDENAATMHHITTNSHHPEYHLENKSDANVNKDDRSKSDKCVDASLMPPSDIVEMIADWQAMSEELQTNTAREWFEKQKDVRWHFTEEQEELIDKLLKVFEEE